MASNYKWMENHLQNINRKCIQIEDDQKKNNVAVLKNVLDDFIAEFKKDDVLFESMYSTICYAGSYWDGIKISGADEYDIDLLLTLPKLTRPIFKKDETEIKINLSNIAEYEKQPYSIKALKSKLLDDQNNLSMDKVNAWFESLVAKAINTIKATNPINYEIVKSFKSGPAKTLSIKTRGQKFDIDLVPSFKFTEKEWPFFCRTIPGNTSGFLIVPKLLNDPNFKTWRLSFLDQEKKILEKKENMKAALRLIKRLRDNDSLFDSIKSYYIKTIFLLEIYENHFEFERKSLSAIFMHMLRKLHEYVDSGKIPYFWIPSINLLRDCKPIYLENLERRLTKIIHKLETTTDEEFLESIFIKK